LEPDAFRRPGPRRLLHDLFSTAAVPPFFGLRVPVFLRHPLPVSRWSVNVAGGPHRIVSENWPTNSAVRQGLLPTHAPPAIITVSSERFWPFFPFLFSDPRFPSHWAEASLGPTSFGRPAAWWLTWFRMPYSDYSSQKVVTPTPGSFSKLRSSLELSDGSN